ncbi:PREDICTED: chromatin assembly factor 1 subunit FAS1 isoform X1 [Theobroma cacao]|uniref:Chromatin assembly factor 1 subunit FAS1 isoform X1 n=1 Tax=Theobroma cacao TaxID=3641 RepID=A0AB32WG22_THECC|nr:PREDICTED: chromatin assembly factor 1 subunit FAS1 isoform X1 [Theobroma cacao]
MADSATVIDVDDHPKVPKTDSQDQPKRTGKRKRASWVSETLSDEQREAQIKELKQEMDGLYGYYKEVMEPKSGFGMGFGLGLVESGPLNSVVAVLMEESDLPLSRLVEAIHEKVKDSMGNVSLAAVKSAVLFVGQRVKYGLGSEDADILEDDANSSLWCWETRDVKLMPKSVRATLKIRRTCRKKINERFTAVSAMITLLQKWENDQNYKHDFMKASEKLVKVLSEAEIRLLMCNMLQKSGAEMAEKEAKREEKLLIKQFERNRREIEKEKKKVDRELQKEKLQNEKERKRLQEEVEKDERRREREEAEMRKQLRKQQEEVERDQRRREKEEAELKKQLSIQKQASLMERFLKKCKTSPRQIEQLTKPATFCPSTQKSEKVPEAITLLMDTTLSSKGETYMDDLRKLHLSSWRHLGHFLHSNQKQCWGMRRKPKTELFKELKLTANKGSSHDELSVERIIDGWGEENSDDRSCFNPDISAADVKCCGRKQLLQFDKSYRPAFFGIWPKKSNVVGPRCPLRKDPDLDYDVDSDEEWEEEEPGESLSDCDKDEEEESFEGCSKADDEDESEDGFFVPDGYLSENEGVQVDGTGTDVALEETKSSPMSEQDGQNEEFYTFLRQQKYLNSLTEHALQKNQPLIILNISHEKTSVLMAEDLTNTCKLELTCLQALSMRACPDGSPVEISVDSIADDNQEACLSSSKASTTPVLTVAPILDSDMPLIVSTIQSCSLGINRLVESLQQKFPSIPKSQLKTKVREISEFSDNRWQVHRGLACSYSTGTCTAGHSRKSRKKSYRNLAFQFHQRRVVEEPKLLLHFSQKGACLLLIRVSAPLTPLLSSY